MRFARPFGIVTTLAIGLLAVAGLVYGAQNARADDQTVSWSLPTTSEVTINVGDTVTWTWADSIQHSVTSQSGPATFDSGIQTGVGQTFSFTFNEAGTYTYRCEVHPSSMTGTVNVMAAATNTPTATPATATATTATATATATTAPTNTATAVATATNTQAPTTNTPGPTATMTTPQPPSTGTGTDGSGGNSAVLWLAGIAVLAIGAGAIYAGRRAWR